uniref:Zonadhesin n=1 Tax=Leptobrachium leishanense TaxID=445787 RepID=A0A8C5QIV1_9ANUR
MCGNLNGDRRDDFMKPNGQQAQNANQFGDSWMVDYDNDLTCTPVPTPEVCSKEKEEMYESNAYCGIITSRDGPFQACHSLINPQRFLSACVFDLCAVGVGALCPSLEAYGSACHMEGLPISWRTSTFCPLRCPANSHYKLCSTACPPTCLDLSAPINCSKPCMEDCECNEGFVLGGSSCVPISNCGCLYNNLYYERGSTFWRGECEGQCTCIEHNRVDCNNNQCGTNEVCKVHRGVLGCHPEETSICHIYGDPHYFTFDGKLYHFQGSCTYTTVETCSNSSVNFSVTTRNEHRGSLAWTALNSVDIRIGDLHVTLGKNKTVYVNGLLITLPVNVIPGISLYQSGSYVILWADFGLEVKFDGDLELFVKVSEKFKEKLCGLCGTYTSSIHDDFLKPDGFLAHTSNEFGNSWRIPDDDWVCDENVIDPLPCNPTDKRHYEELCKVLMSDIGPLRRCQHSIPAPLYFESCVYDQCATGGNQELYCKALESYAAACESAGVSLGDWKKDTVCGIDDRCQMACSFDSDFCQWKQSSSDNIDWIRHRGATQTTSTGPSFDHTTGYGFYMYINEYNSTQGDVARLESPECEVNEPHCLSFWYHMFGAATSMELRVYILTNDGMKLVSSHIGNNGDLWRMQEIFLMNTGRFQIIIEGIRGETIQSDVAVDDIYFLPGYCMTLTTTTTTTTTTTRTTVATTSNTLPPGSCVVYGDPHYYTFDKQVHHFMGTCTYTLSKVCENGTQPHFNVEAANEHRGGNTKVSYVKFVRVVVHGHRIIIEKDKWVKVDEIFVVLPVTLTPGINIFLSGSNVVVTTDFGLTVKFDGNHRVEVTVPGQYADKVCGICGNFNGDATDDFLNPNEELEANSADLGNSWQVVNDSSCFPGIENTPDCTDEEDYTIASNSLCGIITDINGPFRDCHTIIDPLAYFYTCAYDLCELDMDLASLCNSLHAYSEACHPYGITIHPWRNESFCPLQCPANSHYEQCGTACPATCVNPASPSTCKFPCAEGCICNKGYVLYDKACVPVNQCGCWYGGKHYPVGSESWTDDTCSTNCRCLSAGSALTCNSASCPPDKHCGITDGVPGCYGLTFGKCEVGGDPHYYTFDKSSFHFQGMCTYTLSKLCGNSTSFLPYFNVEGKNMHQGRPSFSSLQKVIVDAYNHRITIVRGESGHVLVNDVWVSLPISLANGSLTVQRSGRFVQTETDFKLTVAYDTNQFLVVKLPTTFSNQICGMCGNLNGDRRDDFMKPNGQQAQNANQFGDSWMVDYDNDLTCTPVPTPEVCSKEKEEMYESNAYCGIITSRDGPFQACHSLINPQRFLSACVFDLCAVGVGALCPSLEAYGSACHMEGLPISWRTSTFCPLRCPANSHYKLCSTACPPTCLDLSAPINCSKPCMEDCECNEGFVLGGSSCVPISNCGCLYNNLYYERGSTFWRGECEGQCTCIERNRVDCNNNQCGTNEVCKVHRGVLGCHPAETSICHIYGDPHYFTFDGKLYHFQGSCTYTTVETCSNSSVNFSVTTRNEHRGSLAWTALNSVDIRIWDLHVTLGKNKTVYVNGLLITLPVNVIPGISLHQTGSYVVLLADFGLEVKFDGSQELFVKVSEKFKEKLCGLCGTYTNSIHDDFLKPDGFLAHTSNEFGNSWRIPDDDWVCDEYVIDPLPCNPTDKRHYEELCKVIVSHNGPLGRCQYIIPASLYFESCVYDQCATGGNQELYCNALGFYAAACESAGVFLGDWKKDTVCGIDDRCQMACSFDSDFCQWKQSSSDNIDWIRHRGATQTTSTGPYFDHTTGYGFYIYINEYNSTQGDVARLESPECEVNEPHCFSFWYHMFGRATSMELRVYVVSNNGTELVSSHLGNKGDMWRLQEVLLLNSGIIKVRALAFCMF